MTDVAAAPLTEQAYAEAGIAEPSAASFAELVWIHHRWAQAFRSNQRVPPELESDYRTKLRAFEQEHGELLNAYWCNTTASAVTLTVKPAWGPLRYFGREPTIRYHRATDWVIKRAPTLTHVLHRCDALAIRTSEILRGTTERTPADPLGLESRARVRRSHKRDARRGDTARVRASRAARAEPDRDLLQAGSHQRRPHRLLLGDDAGLLVLALIAPLLAGLLCGGPVGR
jgi:hypothetical protein